MKIEKVRKESFTVIGKEGSTLQGEGFIQKLYDEANAHLMKSPCWQEKMNRAICLESGV